MQFQDDINTAVLTLKSGGLILYPTDTVWGIGCDATNEVAVSKIYQLKNRNEEKSMIILLADETEITKYTRQPNLKTYQYLKGITNPVTIIYADAVNLAKNLINPDGSVGIRIVKDPFCSQLIQAFGKPIVSTSSNISGYPPPALFIDIDNNIKSSVDYIVKHRQDDMNPSRPSMVIRMLGDGDYEILRK